MICCSARQQTIDGSEHENSCMLLTTKRHGEDGQEQTKRSASRRRRHYGRRSGDESRTLATAVLPTGRIPSGLVMFDDDGMQRHDVRALYLYARARQIFRGYCVVRDMVLYCFFYIYFFVSIHVSKYVAVGTCVSSTLLFVFFALPFN